MPYVKMKRPFYLALRRTSMQSGLDACFIELHAKLGSGTVAFDYQVISAIADAVYHNVAHDSGDRVIVRYNIIQGV